MMDDLKFTTAEQYMNGIDEQTKKDIHAMIRENIVDIKFEKVDGSMREMRATLNFDHVPIDKMPKDLTRTYSDTALRVFDIEINDWRSFRWENLREANVVDNTCGVLPYNDSVE